MSVFVWGANSYGQLGLGFSSEQVPRPTKIDFIPGLSSEVNLVDPKNLIISGGGSETCFVTSKSPNNSTLISIGVSDLRKLTSLTESEKLPRPISIPTGFKSISSGWDFHVSIDFNGSVHTWGSNGFGQLGRHSSISSNYDPNPQPLKDINKAIAVSAGLRHAAALSEDGKLYLWGDNSKGHLGVESPDRKIQAPVPAIFCDDQQVPTFTHVACGNGFTIASDTKGGFWGCGINKYGQLLVKREDPIIRKFTPLGLEARLPEGTQVDKIKCGWTHTLVLLKDGNVIGWGRNNLYQLGSSCCIGPTNAVYVNIQGLNEPIQDIFCGSEHNLALGKSGKVYCWGWNEHDNCGVKSDDGEEFVAVPTQVLLDEKEHGKVVKIATGYGNSFVVTER